MNALKADPRSVDMRALAPHFYRLGIRILQLFDEEELVEILGDVRHLLTILLAYLLTAPRRRSGSAR